MLGLRSAQAVVLHDYWRSHPGTALDVVTLKVDDPRLAVAAVRAGDVDASFRSVTDPAALPPEVRMIHAFHSPLELVVGPRHPLASARTVTPARLRGHRIWVPGIAPGSEWAEFYQQLTAEFGLRVDAAGPNFGNEVLLDILADSDDVATLVGSRDRYVWPTGHDLRRIPIAGPTLAYPLSLLLPGRIRTRGSGRSSTTSRTWPRCPRTPGCPPGRRTGRSRPRRPTGRSRPPAHLGALLTRSGRRPAAPTRSGWARATGRRSPRRCASTAPPPGRCLRSAC